VPAHVSSTLQTSPVYRIEGQKSRWRYPDPRLTANNCEVLTNVNLGEFGSADSRYGYELYNSTTLPNSEPVAGLWQETFKDGTTRNVVLTLDKAYVDDGTTRTDVTGSNFTGGADDRFRFAFLKNSLIMTNGVDQVRTWDGSLGSNTTDLTGMPWTKCDDILEHKGLLIALSTTESGTKHPTRIRWSGINTKTFVADLTTWADGNRFEVYEDGTPIIGGVDNFGQVLVFKSDGLYPGRIEYNQGYIEYAPGEPRRGFSPVAKNSFIARPEFVFGVAREGAFVVTPDMNVKIVTLDIMNEWNTLQRDRLKYAQAFVRERDHQIRVLMSGQDNSSGHDRILVFDWETGDTWFDEPTDVMGYAQSIEIADDERDWFGSNGGKLFTGNISSLTEDNDVGFAWRVKMVANDLGLPGRTKNIVYFRTLTRKRASQASISLSLARDQGRLSPRLRTITMSTNIWDTANNWSSASGWNSGGIEEDRFYVNRHAESIAPEWESNTPATLVGYQVEYELVEP